LKKREVQVEVEAAIEERQEEVIVIEVIEVKRDTGGIGHDQGATMIEAKVEAGVTENIQDYMKAIETGAKKEQEDKSQSPQCR